MSPEEEILLEYETKVLRLQNYLETGELAQDEYDELIKDFSDIDAVRDSIKDEKMKIHAEMIISHLSKVLAVI